MTPDHAFERTGDHSGRAVLAMIARSAARNGRRAMPLN
jgi:hypothetical protein